MFFLVYSYSAAHLKDFYVVQYQWDEYFVSTRSKIKRISHGCWLFYKAEVRNLIYRMYRSWLVINDTR